MYFDAVEEMLKKIDNPSISKKKKRELEKELAILDPKKKMQNFIKFGGERPDISEETAPYEK
jgi:hypothetical protein